MMTFEESIKKEEELAFGEITPADRLQNQIRLAEKMFEKFKGSIDRNKFHDDVGYRNEIMSFWTDGDEQSFSSAYRRLEKSDWFKNHQDLNGDIFKIKIEHLLDFIEFEKQNF